MNTLLIADGTKLTMDQIDQINEEFGATYINYLDSLGNKGKRSQEDILKDANNISALHDIEEKITLLEVTHVKATKALKKRLQDRGLKVKFV